MNQSTRPHHLSSSLSAIALTPAIWVCLCLLLGVVAAHWLKPVNLEIQSAPNLEATIPKQFGDWKELPNPYVQVSLSTDTTTGLNQPYDQTLMRTYVNSQGQQIMLALAWGQRQSQEVKIHRPDLCYVAQGFTVKSLQPAHFDGVVGPSTPVTGKHMVAMNAHSGEAVAYWIRIGSVYSESAWETRKHILREGFDGRIPDGILVRASQTIRKADEAAPLLPQLEQFLAELYAATPAHTRALMAR